MADNVLHSEDAPTRRNPGVGSEREKREPQPTKEPRVVVPIDLGAVAGLVIRDRNGRAI